MSQLRKSSSAASHTRKFNKINYLQATTSDALLSLVPSVTCDVQAALYDVRNWSAYQRGGRTADAGSLGGMVGCVFRDSPELVVV